MSEMVSANLARSSSASDVATSAEHGQALLGDFARPPSTDDLLMLAAVVMVRMPGRIAATTGA